jgi:ketosteroid isomerase-like protein
MADSALAKPLPDEELVRDLIQKAFSIINSDRFEDYFELFTQDAVWMMPSEFKDVSCEAAKSFYGFTDKFRFDQETTLDELRVSGDLAFARISLAGYLRPVNDPNGSPLRSVSRHIWLMEKQPAGDWKIARDIWNNPKENRQH